MTSLTREFFWKKICLDVMTISIEIAQNKDVEMENKEEKGEKKNGSGVGETGW
jgi:hypothetical protein